MWWRWLAVLGYGLAWWVGEGALACAWLSELPLLRRNPQGFKLGKGLPNATRRRQLPVNTPWPRHLWSYSTCPMRAREATRAAVTHAKALSPSMRFFSAAESVVPLPEVR